MALLRLRLGADGAQLPAVGLRPVGTSPSLHTATVTRKRRVPTTAPLTVAMDRLGRELLASLGHSRQDGRGTQGLGIERSYDLGY